MKQYHRILSFLFGLIIFVLMFTACTSTESTPFTTTRCPITQTPAFTTTDGKNTTVPIETTKTINTSEPSDTSEPNDPPSALVPRPINDFSPTDVRAGMAFVSENKVATFSYMHGISRFFILADSNAPLPFNVACYITQTEISALLPDGIDLSKLTVNFRAQYSIFLDGKEIRNGDTVDASSPRELVIRKNDSVAYKVTLNIQTLHTGLPSIALTVEDFAEINSKDRYFSSTFYVGGGDNAICDYATNQSIQVDAEAKGRGNTSWWFPKKGFTIKLSEKVNVLGLGRSRNWTLISSYQDKTLMRNEIAAHLSEIMGLPTMNTRSVDLWLNGEYFGTYLLIEKIEFEKERLDYPDHDEVDDPSEAGVLLEWDGHVGEVSSEQINSWIQITDHTYYDPIADINFIRLENSYIVIHKPSADHILDEQIERAESIVMQVNNALIARNYEVIQQYLDLESFAAWYLVEDIMKNMDAQLHSSCYMYISGDGKLHMGPVWDFDMSLGNANYNGVDNPNGAYISTKRWFKHLFAFPEFCELVQTMLLSHEEELDGVPEYMDAYVAMLDRSQTYNFKRWDIMNGAVGANPPNVIQANTYSKQIQLMKDFYKKRLKVVRDLVANACAS